MQPTPEAVAKRPLSQTPGAIGKRILLLRNDVAWTPHSRFAFRLIEDAIKKSVPEIEYKQMCSDNVFNPVLDLIDARVWLMDDTKAMPGEDIGNGLVAGLTRNSCLTVCNISRNILIEQLRPLWLREDKNMCGSIAKALNEATGTIERLKRTHPKKPGQPGPDKTLKHRRQRRLLYTARDVHQRSLDWIRSQ